MRLMIDGIEMSAQSQRERSVWLSQLTVICKL